MVVEERELFNSQPNLFVIGPEVNAKFGKAYPEDILVMNQKQLGINNSDHTLNYGAGDVNAQINIDGYAHDILFNIKKQWHIQLIWVV